jgi:hypothetical protein
MKNSLFFITVNKEDKLTTMDKFILKSLSYLLIKTC